MKNGSPEKLPSSISFCVNTAMDLPCNCAGVASAQWRNEEWKGEENCCMTEELSWRKRGQDVASDMYGFIRKWSLAACLRREEMNRQKGAFWLFWCDIWMFCCCSDQQQARLSIQSYWVYGSSPAMGNSHQKSKKQLDRAVFGLAEL